MSSSVFSIFKGETSVLSSKSQIFNDNEFLEVITEIYDSDSKVQRFSNAITCGPVSWGQFQHIVCCDLKLLIHNRLRLLMLQLDAVQVTETNKMEETVKSVFSVWISYFRIPHHFLSNNRGNFNNDYYRQMENYILKLLLYKVNLIIECTSFKLEILVTRLNMKSPPFR